MSNELDGSFNRLLRVLCVLGALFGWMCSRAEAQQGRTWSGQVLDIRTGKPISGAEVQCGIVGSWSPFPGSRVTTNDNGEFSGITWPDKLWKGMKAGERNHYLEVNAVQQATWQTQANTGYWNATVARPSPSRVTVRLVPRPVWIKGQVVSAEDGTPLANESIGLGAKAPGAAEFRTVQTVSVRSDAEGYFSLGPAKGFSSDDAGFPQSLHDIPANLSGRYPAGYEAAARAESEKFEKIRSRVRGDGLGSYLGWADPGPYYEFAIGVGGSWYELPPTHIVTSIDDSIHAYAVVRVPRDAVKGQTMPADSVSSELRGAPKTPAAEADPTTQVTPDPIPPTATTPPPSPKEPAQVDRLTLRADSRRAKTGETVAVPVWLLQGSGLIDLSFNLEFDPAVVQAVGNIRRGNLLTGAEFEANPARSGVVQIGLVPPSGGITNSQGTLAQINFQAIGPAGSRTALRLVPRKSTLTGGQPANPALIHGEIVIVGDDGFVPGDVNGDGRVGMDDVLMILKISVELLPFNARADIDGDGQVTAADARVAREIILGRPSN